MYSYQVRRRNQARPREQSSQATLELLKVRIRPASRALTATPRTHQA